MNLSQNVFDLEDEVNKWLEESGAVIKNIKSNIFKEDMSFIIVEYYPNIDNKKCLIEKIN